MHAKDPFLHEPDEQHKRDKCQKPYRVPYYARMLVVGGVCSIVQGVEWLPNMYCTTGHRWYYPYGCVLLQYVVYYVAIIKTDNISHHPRPGHHQRHQQHHQYHHIHDGLPWIP